MNIYGKDKKPVVIDGKVLRVDSVIGASWFSSKRDTIYSAYLKPGEKFRPKKWDTASSPVSPIVLPTNKDVAVAEYLKKDPNIIFVGTVSDPRFEWNLAKLAQLPIEPREALLRNDAENAVAIGFRWPDTQAAINIWLSEREVHIDSSPERLPSIYTFDGKHGSTKNISLEKQKTYRLPNDIERYKFLLSSLINYEFGKYRYEIQNDTIAKNWISFTISENSDGLIVIDFSVPIPDDFRWKIQEIFQTKDIQSYITAEFKTLRWRNKKIKTQLYFKNGKLDLKESYTESWV